MFRRARTPLVVLAVALALYTAFGFLIAPGLLRSALLGQMTRALTTRPALGRVRVNPLALSLTLEKLAIPDERGKLAIGFERLYLRFSLLSPFHRAWTLDELRVEKPAIGLAVLEDRTLNLMRLVRPQPAGADTGGRPPALLIHHLRVVDGTLTFEDRSRVPEYSRTLIPIRLELTEFGTRRDRRNEYSLEASTDAGETLSWSGRFTLEPFSSQGRFRIGRLRAATIEDLLDDVLPFVVSSGEFDFAAGYRLDAARVPAELAVDSLAIDARDAALSDRASGEEVIAVHALATRGGTITPARLEAGLGSATLDGLRVHIWMEPDGKTNFDRWAAAAPPDTAPPWTTGIETVNLAGGEVEFQDRRLRPPPSFRMTGARAELHHFSTKPDAEVPLVAACSLATGGLAHATGTLRPGVPSADLALEVKGFALHALEPYVRVFSRVAITGGTADGKGRLRFHSFGAAGPLLRFEGDAVSRDFAMVDLKVERDFLKWKRLDLVGLAYDFLPMRFTLKEVRMTEPYVRMIVAPDRTTNVQAMTVPPDSVPLAFRPPPDQPDTIPARIDRVKIENGSMYFADLSLTPNFATGIRSLNGEIRGLSSARAASAVIALDGKVDEYAPVKIFGSINPLNNRDTTDVGVSFENIELTTFTPYSGRFMGYRIEKGKLDLHLRYVVEGRQLRGENKVFMRQLTLGEKVESDEATKLPVRFALALLKDRNGDIDLDLPVHGDLDDPKFSVGRLIVKVLLSLITKAVTSPFALFGALFGGDDQAAPAVHFAYGSAKLDSTEIVKLEAIRKGLGERPALKLEVEASGDAVGDSLALVARRYHESLRAGPVPTPKAADPARLAAAAARAPAGMTAAEYLERLTRSYTAAFGKPPELEGPKTKPVKGAPPDPARVVAEDHRLAQMEQRLRAAVRLQPDEVAIVARERAQAVQGFLLADSTIAPERVFIVGNKGAYRADSTGVRLGLTLSAD